MRRVVLLNDAILSDTSSNDIYERYVSLLTKDISRLLATDRRHWRAIACPGCSRRAVTGRGKRYSMTFSVCRHCGTWYVSPRPSQDVLDAFYRDSRACRFWRRHSLELSDEKLALTYGPRLTWIIGLVDEFIAHPAGLLDCGTKYPYLLKQLLFERLFERIYAPDQRLFELADLMPPEIIQRIPSGRPDERISLVTAFETIERATDPRALIRMAARVLEPGGLLLLTTSTCDGLEYQALGADAPNINPINRMTLFSLKSLSALLSACGLEIIELSTPGRFDVEIVRRFLKANPRVSMNTFLARLLTGDDETLRINTQAFLQENLLSSHVRIAARRQNK